MIVAAYRCRNCLIWLFLFNFGSALQERFAINKLAVCSRRHQPQTWLSRGPTFNLASNILDLTTDKDRSGIVSYLKKRRIDIASEFKANPWTYLSIPVVAALVGYITNYVGVKMLFYPTQWRGIPLLRFEGQPLGLVGWQGIVPAKRFAMAGRMVDVTISRLLKVSEVFNRLEPKRLAELLSPTVSSSILNGWIPNFILRFFLRRTSKDLLRNIEKVVDIKSIVVSGMTSDPSILGSFFQRVGSKELQFLIDSGFGFGFLLGLLQMLQWMVYPRNWTLPVGGAIVGFITNWIALKWIFEPLVPTRYGPFVLHGMFLKRQAEVSNDFCEYISDKILTSQKVWLSVFEDTLSLQEVRKILGRNVPLTPATINQVVEACRTQLGRWNHPIHSYTTKSLNLKATLIERMNKLTPFEFEQVLHPIFQEDEFTLIVAGGVLGTLAGAIQMAFNLAWEKRVKAREDAMKKVESVGNSSFSPGT